MIKVRQHVMQGNGTIGLVDKWINKEEVSTITKTDGYYGSSHKYTVAMSNGEKFIADLNIKDFEDDASNRTRV
jgi:hypothetical protein